MKTVVILVLVVAALLFALGAGFAFAKPKPKKTDDPRTEGRNHERTSFESWLAGMKLPGANSVSLKKSTYQVGSPAEEIGTSDRIRTVKFRLTTSEACEITIRFITRSADDDQLHDQTTHLLRTPDDGKDGDRREATIVLTKSGGKLSFGPCSVHKAGSCPGRIQVEK